MAVVLKRKQETQLKSCYESCLQIAEVPNDIKNKSVGVDGDIGEIMEKL